MSEVASDVQYKELKKILTKEQKEELTMCIIADELVGQGRQAGLQEGRREGQLDTICSLIKGGMLKIEEGAAFLNVTIEEMRIKIGQVCI